MNRISEINQYFKDDFDYLFNLYRNLARKDQHDTLVNFIIQSIINYNPFYITTEEGVENTLKKIFASKNIREFIEKLFFIFRQKLTTEEYYDLLTRLSDSSTMSGIDAFKTSGTFRPSGDTAIYMPSEAVKEILIRSPHMVMVLMICCLIRDIDKRG